MSFVVAIDGPAGSGKGTVAKLVGEKLNLLNIDTGAMFRCIALKMLRNNIAIDNEKEIDNILENIDIELHESDNSLKVFLDKEDVSLEIRREEISNFVSPVSTLPNVRKKLLELQRNIANGKNVIMEGRDIGTVVFPNANVKIYLEASSEERAKRRVKQNIEKGIEANYEKILEDIKIRDKRDSTREIAPLKKADDAILVDSTNLTIEQVVKKVIDIIKEKDLDKNFNI